MAAAQRLGGRGEDPGGQRRLGDPRRARGRGIERSGRAAARSAREGRVAGGRDRPARLAGLEVAAGARQGTGVRTARDRVDARGGEDPRGRPDLEGRRGPTDDGAPPVREMASGRLPALRHEGVRAPGPAGEAARPRGVHREDSSDLLEHGIHGDRWGLRPVRVLELRRPVPAAGPSGARPTRHVLPGQAVDPPPSGRVDLGKVAEAHENGGVTGSTGWRYKWDRKEAERAVLRSHTTPVTLKWLMEHPKPPQKAFIIGRNFRPDATDWKHLPEFHQIEGVVMEQGANLAQLIGTIEAFYQRLGFTRVKFRPGYFPYTEPSMEPEGQTYDGRWMGLGGSGIFRPEVTVPLGIDSPVLAWGLGLERLVMTIEGLSDIRQLYLSDLDWLRDHRAIL